MIKTLLKHKLAEIAINNLFDNIQQNFVSQDTSYKIDEQYESIDITYGERVKIRRIYTKCRIIDTHLNERNNNYNYITCTYVKVFEQNETGEYDNLIDYSNRQVVIIYIPQIIEAIPRCIQTKVVSK